MELGPHDERNADDADGKPEPVAGEIASFTSQAARMAVISGCSPTIRAETPAGMPCATAQ